MVRPRAGRERLPAGAPAASRAAVPGSAAFRVRGCCAAARGHPAGGTRRMTVGTVALGTGGLQVSRVGLGLMAMSGVYGPADEAESIAPIRAALEAGVTLLDTGVFYGMGHNELLLRDALRGVDRSSVLICVKFGGQRDPAGAFI